MIYYCESCGQAFSKKQLTEALKSTDHIIECAYCGCTQTIEVVSSSRLLDAYDKLASADFFRAQAAFQRLSESNINKNDATEIYIGALLSEYHVKVENGDTENFGMPKMLCLAYNSQPVGECDNYTKAFNSIGLGNPVIGETQRNFLDYYVGYIDFVNEKYKELHASGLSYDVYLAYDESDETSVRNAEIIYNKLVDYPQLGKIYYPQNTIGTQSIYSDSRQRNANDLYAWNNAKCMVVIAGTKNSMSTYLRDIYIGYYRAHGNSDRNLCFVFDTAGGKVLLDNDMPASHAFCTEGDSLYDCIEFICRSNHIIIQKKQIKPKRDSVSVKPLLDNAENELLDSDALSIFPDGKAHIAQYPQSKVTDAAILEYFNNSFERPDKNADKDWTILFSDAKGPYAWYRDEYVNGKKIRGIYCIRFRKKFCGRDNRQYIDSSIPQRDNGGIALRKIVCFEFEKISWKVIRENGNSATLCAEYGLDSMPYELDQQNELSLSQWLNETFINASFSEREKEYLFTAENGNRLFLLNSDEIEVYTRNSISLKCTDYCKCMGVLCAGNGARRFWLVDEDVQSVKVYDLQARGVFDHDSDDTQVAIVPKIIVDTKLAFNK